jgi:hypothetical protein
MKIFYKGFDVEAKREMSMGGEKLLFYSVFRKSDGFEVTSGFSYGTDPVRTFVQYLKGVVDDFLEDPQAYYTSRGMNLDIEELDDLEVEEPMTETVIDDMPGFDEEEK